MSRDVTAVLKFVADDQTAQGLSSANRNLRKQEQAIKRVIDQQKKLTREAGKSADQIAVETLKRNGATEEVISQTIALQEERQAILAAKSARTDSINEVDKMIAAMKEQAATIGMSNSELAVHKAMQQGANAAQIATIQATQAEIAAKRQASQATTQQTNSTDQLISKLEQELATSKMTEDQAFSYKLAMQGATQAQINQVFALKTQIQTMRQSMPLYERMKKQLRFIRGGFGQVGHQVQDIAVQLQGGTDAMIVFGQQGSQIASLFGPGGAAIGALLAVGAAAFTVFKNFELTTNQVDEMRQEFEAFTPKSKEAQEALALAMQILAQQERNNLREEIEQTTEKMGDAVTKAVLAQHAFEATRGVLGATTKAELTEEIGAAGQEAFLAKAKVFALREELQALGGMAFDFPDQALFDQIDDLFSDIVGGDPSAAVTPEVDSSDAAKAMEEFIKLEGKALTGVAAINNFFDQEVANIQAVGAAAGAAQDRINDAVAKKNQKRSAAISQFYADEYAAAIKHFEMIRKAEQQRLQGQANAQQQEKDRTKALSEETLAGLEEQIDAEQQMREGNLAHFLDVIKRTDEATAESKRKKALLAQQEVQMNLQILSSAQNLAGGLMASMDKSSKAYKAMFVAQQAMAIATTIINTEQASIAALNTFPGPQGIAFSKMIRAIGYASVGMIAAQTVSSFEGGGFTGKGSRSGGVDGKGGFPAILHPNESVIDHEQGGQAPVVVHQTINVTTGVQQTVRAEIANLLPQISEAAKSAVHDSRLRGGNFG